MCMEEEPMRLRRGGVLALGLMFLTLTGAPAAMAADGTPEPISLDPSPTVEATASPTVEPTAVPTGTEAPQPDLVPVHVAVWLCDEAKCPEPAQILAGVTVSAVDSANLPLTQCVTAGDPAGCDFAVPAGVDWTLGWDDAAIPAGYVFDGIATVTGGGWEGEAYIIQFVPAPVEPQVETVHVGVMLCESAACEADGALLAGIGVASVETATNTQVDNCETAGDPAVCAIDVPLYSPWTFTWDSTAVPEGYRYIGELAVVQGGAYPVVYLIRLVPDDVPAMTPTTPAVPTVAPAPTGVPVSGLPKTGAGMDTPAHGLTAIAMLAVMASAAGLAGLGAAVVRRRGM